MIVTVPAEMPVTTPVALTVPIPRSLLLHVPPELASSRSEFCPTHTVVEPVIGDGAADGSTVTTVFCTQVAEV